MAAHPVARVLLDERVGRALVREHMHEEASPGLEPARDAREDVWPVAQVLEHLHRDDAVEVAGPGLEAVDVAGDHPQVDEPARLGLLLDVAALRVRVRHRGDAAAAVVVGHPQAQRAPAAAQFQDVLAVHQSGAFAGHLQRGGLGLPQVLHAFGPEAAAVLAMRAQRPGEEFGRHLVVLLVGLLGDQRDRRAAHLLDEGLVGLLGGLGVGGMLLGQPLLEQAADAQADDAIRHQALFDPADGAGGGGGHGAPRRCVPVSLLDTKRRAIRIQSGSWQARVYPAAVTRYAQRRPPARRCSTRSTRAPSPRQRAKICSSERHSPWHDAAAAQIGQ